MDAAGGVLAVVAKARLVRPRPVQPCLERVARIRERWLGWRGLLPPGWQRRLCGWQDAGCHGLSWPNGRRGNEKGFKRRLPDEPLRKG